MKRRLPIARDPQLSTLQGLVRQSGLTDSLSAAGPAR